MNTVMTELMKKRRTRLNEPSFFFFFNDVAYKYSYIYTQMGIGQYAQRGKREVGGKKKSHRRGHVKRHKRKREGKKEDSKRNTGHLHFFFFLLLLFQ